MTEENIEKEEGSEESPQNEAPEEQDSRSVDNSTEPEAGKPEEEEGQDAPSCCAAPSAKCAKLAIVVILVMGGILLIFHAMNKSQTPVPPTAPVAQKTPVVQKAKPVSPAEDVDPEGALFLFIPGNNEMQAKKASGEIDLAVRKLRALKRDISAVTIERASSDHDWLVEGFSIEKFPAVVAVAKDNSARLIDGEITREKLVRAFVTVACKNCGSVDCDGSCVK